MALFCVYVFVLIHSGSSPRVELSRCVGGQVDQVSAYLGDIGSIRLWGIVSFRRVYYLIIKEVVLVESGLPVSIFKTTIWFSYYFLDIFF